jgi:hypothetical protein
MRVSCLRLLLGAFVVWAGMSGVAFADTLIYQPNDSDLDDLDHHYVYTWKITNITASIPVGHVVESAYLFFNDISNWNNDENKLFMHLLDTSLAPLSQRLSGTTKSSGNTSKSGDEAIHYAYKAKDAKDSTTGFIKDHLAVVPGVWDYFSTSIDGGPSAVNSLVADGTKNTPLGEHIVATGTGRVEGWAEGDNGDLTHSFRTTVEDYKYDFNAAQILKLNEYIANGGDIAFGLDPDCHFFNEGIKFVMKTHPGGGSSVPEPALLALLGMGVAGAYTRRHRTRKVA